MVPGINYDFILSDIENHYLALERVFKTFKSQVAHLATKLSYKLNTLVVEQGIGASPLIIKLMGKTLKFAFSFRYDESNEKVTGVIDCYEYVSLPKPQHIPVAQFRFSQSGKLAVPAFEKAESYNLVVPSSSMELVLNICYLALREKQRGPRQIG